jgi:hypothetical protein
LSHKPSLSSDEEYPVTPTMKEYLRFTAGMDERKTAYQHWIVLNTVR